MTIEKKSVVRDYLLKHESAKIFTVILHPFCQMWSSKRILEIDKYVKWSTSWWKPLHVMAQALYPDI